MRGYHLAGLFITVAFIVGLVLPAGGVSAKEASRKAEDVLSSPRKVLKYDPEGRRDPFLSMIAITKQRIKQMIKRRKSLNPLENYDLTDIKLLGIVYDGREYYASVLLPDGKGFTVREGMNIGVKGGKIIKILPDRMIVREYIPDIKTGQMRPMDTIMKLHKEEE